MYYRGKRLCHVALIFLMLLLFLRNIDSYEGKSFSGQVLLLGRTGKSSHQNNCAVPMCLITSKKLLINGFPFLVYVYCCISVCVMMWWWCLGYSLRRWTSACHCSNSGPTVITSLPLHVLCFLYIHNLYILNVFILQLNNDIMTFITIQCSLHGSYCFLSLFKELIGSLYFHQKDDAEKDDSFNEECLPPTCIQRVIGQSTRLLLCGVCCL